MFIRADFSEKKEPLRPVHGVNNGPQSGSFLYDSSKWFREAGIPYSRLHDTEGAYGAGEFVDIPCVFKCFDADPECPASYNFEMTDLYIRAIRETGTKVIYRLGVSIENGPHKKYIYPPKDYHQWARICEGIIRHYTEGWADGMIDGVEYFEIWNEPEFLEHMWMGTYEEFYRLFKDTLIYLKKRFPNVKIGGPATGYTQDSFTHGFFEYMAGGERAPMDFFSFHTYFHSVEQIAVRADYTRGLLRQYGYEGLPFFITEWSYVTDWGDMENAYRIISDLRGAAFAGRAMCELQKAGYAIATYYDARFNTPFNGLFKRSKGKYHHDKTYKTDPKPSYFALKAYGDLYRLGTETASETDETSVSVLAASNGTSDGLLIARFDPENGNVLTLPLSVRNTHGKHLTLSTFLPDGETWETKELRTPPDTVT
mgnify:CR=1 FL=1